MAGDVAKAAQVSPSSSPGDLIVAFRFGILAGGCSDRAEWPFNGPAGATHPGRDHPSFTARRLHFEGNQDGCPGRFSFAILDGGEYRLTAESPGFTALTRTIAVQSSGKQVEDLQFNSLALQNESTTVSASVSDVGVFEPDPAQRVMVRDETPDANPGRPGCRSRFPGCRSSHRPEG